MSGYTNFKEFLNILAPERIKVDCAAKRAFEDVDVAMNHLTDWFDEESHTKVARGDHQRKYIDKITALAYLAGNIGEGKIIYVGSSSGVVPYACARQTKRQVIAVDSAEVSWKYTQALQKKLPKQKNLEFRKAKLEDVVAELQDNDTLFSFETNHDMRLQMLEATKHMLVNAIFTSHWPVSHPADRWFGVPYHVVHRDYFKDVDSKKYETFAAPDPDYPLAVCMLVKVKGSN